MSDQNLVVLVFVRPNSSYVRPKLKVIGQMSCQVKYLFSALEFTEPNKMPFDHLRQLWLSIRLDSPQIMPAWRIITDVKLFGII